MMISKQLYEDFKFGFLDGFYAEAWASLMSYASRLLGSQYAMMAEDCVQEAIVSVYNTRHTLTSPSNMKTLLFTCVHNKCVTMLRKNNNQNKYLNQVETTEQEISASIIEQETIDMLNKAINGLPDKYRMIFELNFERGLKNAEAAELLDISLASFNKRKAKMISILREQFKDDKGMLMLIHIVAMM